MQIDIDKPWKGILEVQYIHTYIHIGAGDAWKIVRIAGMGTSSNMEAAGEIYNIYIQLYTTLQQVTCPR